MGAIKDITDLITQLANSVKDRKFAAELIKIQSLALALQSEQLAIIEKDSELVAENHGLKRKMLEMEHSHAEATAELQEKHRAEIAKIIARDEEAKNALEPKTLEILKYFFDAGSDLNDIMIARKFGLSLSMAEYHTDTLITKKFIVQTTVGFGPGSAAYGLTGIGREYVVKKVLAS
jgi:hypothetical protein